MRSDEAYEAAYSAARQVALREGAFDAVAFARSLWAAAMAYAPAPPAQGGEAEGTRAALIQADSLLSVIASRYAAQLPADLIAECREASKACRRVSGRPLAFAEDVELNIECTRRWGS